jgi:hypothetical protein
MLGKERVDRERRPWENAVGPVLTEEKMTEKQNRREHARREARFSIKLGSEAAPSGEWIATEGLNISMGGIYCHVPHFIPTMTKLKATLLLPGGESPAGEGWEEAPFEAEMVVVWSDPERETRGCDTYQIGCAFLPLENEQKRILQGYLDSLDRSAPRGVAR